MDENNFKFSLYEHIYVMQDGKLTIDGIQYENHLEDHTYELVRFAWSQLQHLRNVKG